MQAYARALQNNLPEAEVEVELEEDNLEIDEAIVESEDWYFIVNSFCLKLPNFKLYCTKNCNA